MSLLSILPIYITGMKINSSRTQFLPFILFLIFIFKLYVDKGIKKNTSYPLKLILVIILFIDSVNAIRSNYYYYQVTNESIKEIRNGLDLKPYEKIDIKHRITYLSDYDPKDSKTFWIKDCMNDYVIKINK